MHHLRIMAPGVALDRESEASGLAKPFYELLRAIDR
jgi:hypothetical protein